MVSRLVHLVGGGWLRLSKLEGETGWRVELSMPYENEKGSYPSQPWSGVVFDTNGRIKDAGK